MSQVSRLFPREWVSAETLDGAIDQVMRRLGLEYSAELEGAGLAGWSASKRLHWFINDTISYASRDEFLGLLLSKGLGLQASAAQALRFFRTASMLQKYGIAMPDPQPELIEAIARLAEPRWQGDPPADEGPVNSYYGKDPWDAIFYTEITGVYWAVFDLAPAASNNEASNRLSAGLVFIKTILESVLNSGAWRALQFEYEIDGLDAPKRQIPTDEALRKRIERLLRHPHGEARETNKTWRQVGQHYRNLGVTKIV